MPADHGFGLDDVEGSAPARPDVAEDIPEGAVLPAESWSERIALKDLDLVTEGRVLENQGLARSEQRDHEPDEDI